MVLDGKQPPYVPWSFAFTIEAHRKLQSYYQTQDLETVCRNHILGLGNGSIKSLGNGQFQDDFGVLWDRSVDKDIGNVSNCMLPEPTLKDYRFPNPHDPRVFSDIPHRIEAAPGCFRLFQIGFSLYERAWTLRGMENLMVDFYANPQFVRDLFNTIGDYSIAQVRKALEYDIDAVYFGDDWGQQRGLQMGAQLWREFIAPVLKRMYAVVRDAGRYVFIHSCGKVDELFDDLIAMGLNCFNPFQPEVMDVETLLCKYRGRLTFHGGLSTQQLLPCASPEEVRQATRHLLALGEPGSYILSPAHAVPGDVPVENMVAFIEETRRQAGCA